jgi:hypothetical protein
LQLDDVFITGEHQRFLRDRASASSGAALCARVGDGAKPYFGAAHLGNVYNLMALDGPGQAVA